jgi:hypothetical protein
MMKSNQRGLLGPGSNAGSQVILTLPPTRDLDGDEAINFDDWMAEEHAVAVVKILRPLLVGNWVIRPTEQWGRYVIKNDGWSDYFKLIFLYNGSNGIKVAVCKCGGLLHEQIARVISIQIENPKTIELLAQFVFEQLTKAPEPMVFYRPKLKGS